jgi:hypothetical protein
MNDGKNHQALISRDLSQASFLKALQGVGASVVFASSILHI